MVMAAPVAGLRPLRSSRCETSKVPKPTRDTASPFFKAEVMVSKADSKARVAAALEISASAAMCSIRSVYSQRSP